MGFSLMFQIAIENILANNTGSAHRVPGGLRPERHLRRVRHGRNRQARPPRDCPGQKHFLLGYSQGATVVQGALGELDDESAAAIGGVVMVGNPYRIPGRLSNVDGHGRPDNRTA